jgi:MSHA biogenesis protein MshN
MQAAALYDQLTKLEPQKPVWWLGLGIALESAGKNNAAQEAYSRASNNSDVLPELKTFLNNKIKK